LYDSRGTFLESIGRKGNGPGEFTFITGWVAGQADTTFVFDVGNGRITTLEADGSVVATNQLPYSGFSGIVRLSDNRFVIDLANPTADAVGYPLHVIDVRGQKLRSFGLEAPRYRADQPLLLKRSIAPSTLGLWASHEARYLLELWSTDFKLSRVIEREVDWFKPYDQTAPLPLSSSSPPSPRVSMISEDSAGRLWVAILVPGENWREGVGERTTPQGVRTLGITNSATYWDTMVEVLDPVAGVVIGAARFESNLVSLLGEGRVAAYREDASGNPFFDVWRVNIPF
jgi:hypothetical protein